MDEQLKKLWYALKMKCYSVIKRNELPSHQKNMEEPQMHIAKCKKPIWNDCILHGSNYMTFRGKAKLSDNKIQ